MSTKSVNNWERHDSYAYNSNTGIIYKPKGCLSGVAYAILRTKGYYQEDSLMIAPCCTLEV